MKGIRIHAIVRELSNENIDIIEYTDDTRLYIARSLSPAKVRDVQIDAENRQATVVVPDDQVSLAIGRNGVNVRLASKLTGYSLSLVKEGAEDIELFEFRDEIGADLYDLLIHEGIDTAREFLEADPVVLLRLLPKERILELRSVIHEEFDEREDPRWLRMLDEAENPGSADETTTTETDDDISEAYAEDTPLIDDSMDNEADEDGNEEPVQDDTDNTTEE
jgi:N utilization substance protein A